MRGPELSPRLRMVGELVPEGARLADVGTDHAYLPAALILEGKIPWAIAADLRQGPLNRARATVREYGLTGKVAFRLCDGLSGIRPGEVDAVAAAGMGGETIAHILEGWPHAKAPGITWLLQPMTKAERLRDWLWGQGFSISREKCCTAAGRVYSVMEVRYAGEAVPHEEWERYLGAVLSLIHI